MYNVKLFCLAKNEPRRCVRGVGHPIIGSSHCSMFVMFFTPAGAHVPKNILFTLVKPVWGLRVWMCTLHFITGPIALHPPEIIIHYMNLRDVTNCQAVVGDDKLSQLHEPPKGDKLSINSQKCQIVICVRQNCTFQGQRFGHALRSRERPLGGEQHLNGVTGILKGGAGRQRHRAQRSRKCSARAWVSGAGVTNCDDHFLRYDSDFHRARPLDGRLAMPA